MQRTPGAALETAVPMEKREAFLAAYAKIREEILSDLSSGDFQLPDNILERVKFCLDYNVPHGKLNRGLAVLEAYRAARRCETFEALSEQERQDALLLGWCVEWLQAFFLVADDVMDGSKTRRGRPCYYLLDHIGLSSVNDCLLIEAQIYRLLRRRFRARESDPELYLDLVELFLDTTYSTEVGQMLDLESSTGSDAMLEKFTEQNLLRIYRFKTAIYSFYLPVALGMRLAGIRNSLYYQQAKEILLEMGAYFQAQDDFLDCFGDPVVTGKVGTDIEERKCTWLIVEALKCCSPAQREMLRCSYGKQDSDSVARIKALYRELGLPQRFQTYDQESYARIQRKLEALDADFPVEALRFLLQSIYKRSK
ncbi:farnesyl-diphosphate synthetase [Cyanidioschyzon merolae strain 10D]|jgi:farnesyl diphosphate synthase|uniref:Farnesyl-diphosphate synthetase n=1 Tax=Cyanidioschyzon merolae (strain NIES-3377 / 10D) TaxID=280699 RepID=M1V902_CYAM1|nr:farnesyl-diphosphate synthetase [Cyanidioschyzon merolae strain 10D]BAM81099.1 farnesyl-diphosphate synthetase [Cyanidioschyzon merolae strain 10D]|eukprot:XP_005537135.1 farnesyl-diphosphate synthetase [Cyanidioschyzon merolae strain 10D]